ncbi:MAG: adenylate cyclase, partial [Candidatus Tectomicrobia bacterium]|nr:adenylate cyclase [Candidatus Tectomicrobia bacterium]
EVAATRGLTPLVGREPERAILLRGWEQARDGVGHMLLLSGEPGIGKSRLVQVLKDHVAPQSHLRWECRCSPYYQQTPLFPLTEFFHRALQWHPDDTQAQKVEKLERTLQQYHLLSAAMVPLLAPWLSLSLPEAQYPTLLLSPQQQRQRRLEGIITILLQLAARQPVLFILEDVHWADPTTLALLALLLEQLPAAALYTVLTCRPTFHPLWGPCSSFTQLTLNRLSQGESAAMLSQMVHGKALPPDVLAHVVRKTDGVPLFVEALFIMLLEAGLLQEDTDCYVLTGPLPLSAIPATLQDLLMTRLDQLGEARDLVQCAAVLGRECSYALLQAISALDAPTLQAHLARAKALELLQQRGIPPQAHYRFAHALIQEAAYHSLLTRTRQQMHERVAHVLAAQFPDTIITQPEILAHHYTAADQAAQAVPYWHHAANGPLHARPMWKRTRILRMDSTSSWPCRRPWSAPIRNSHYALPLAG